MSDLLHDLFPRHLRFYIFCYAFHPSTTYVVCQTQICFSRVYFLREAPGLTKVRTAINSDIYRTVSLQGSVIYVLSSSALECPDLGANIVLQSLHARREEILSATRVNKLVQEECCLLRVCRVHAAHEAMLVGVARLAEHGVPARHSRFSWRELRLIVPCCDSGYECQGKFRV